MSGSIKIKSVMTSEDQNCTLTRNLTKFTFNFTNSVTIFEGVEIYSVRIHNVPKENYYYVNNAPVEYADYIIPIDSDNPNAVLDLYKGDASKAQKTWTFYFPQNDFGAQGTFKDVTAKQKNNYAPDRATYIELWGRDKQESLFTLRFYPGADKYTAQTSEPENPGSGSGSTDPASDGSDSEENTPTIVSDFNLKANNSYTLSIVLKSHYSANDTRIYNVQKTILEPSNSYIIKQTGKRYNTSLYAIPMTWMFKYWTQFATNSMEFTNEEELVAEVIWQTQTSQVISFCDENALNISDFGSVKLSVKDASDASADDNSYIHEGKVYNGYIYIRTDANIDGNILVGVKRKDSTEYLWSWHLWVTDYNPDMQSGAWTNGQYIYKVTGGEVHRYVDLDNGYGLWNENGGVYKNKYIMDRHLGSAQPLTDGLYYQFGRKDPLPVNNLTLYGIKGINSSVNFNPSDKDVIIREYKATNLDDAVRKPHTFFRATTDGSTTSIGWCSNNPYNGNPWYNPCAESTGDYSKGIFDPCPPGWTVPRANTWNNFAIARDSSTPNRNSNTKFYIATNPGVTGDPYAVYPISGRRIHTTGAMDNWNYHGFTWSSSLYTSNKPYSLNNWNHPSISTNDSRDDHNAANGMSVRCIQE